MNIMKVGTYEEATALFSTWAHPYAVLDTETTSLNPFDARVISFTLSVPSGEDIYFLNGSFLSFLNQIKVPLVCHNFRYDFAVCFRNGVDLRKQGLLHDTMLLDHLLNEENEHGLDALVKRYWNDDYKEKFWNKYKDIQDATEADLLQYSGKDAGYTAKAYNSLKQALSGVIPDSLVDQTRNLALALYDSEIRGIKVDVVYLNEIGVTLGHQITDLLATLRNSTDIECSSIELELFHAELDKRKTAKGQAGVKRPVFNFGSTHQLGMLLYDQLMLPERKNKQGNRTVDDAALESLEDLHPQVALLRKYRELNKVKTAFIDGTLEKLHAGRIHPSFNVNGTVTGRISSSNPNMQQLPREGGVRGIYIPDPGYVFLSYDYSQLEVTIAAHYSRDPNLLSIITDGASQHDITAKGLGIPRATAKTINFALQYGAGAQKVQKILGCSLVEAEAALERYWETYSGLRDFIKRCHRKIELGEPLVTPFGRIRHLPSRQEMNDRWGDEGWYSRSEKKYIYKRDIYWAGVLRQGPNSMIQGTGADCTSDSFININRELTKLGIGFGMFPIHDENLTQVKEDAVDQAKEIMEYYMCEVGKRIGLTVPLKVAGGKPMKRWSK